jgi:uncharacterized membrane protein
MTIKQYKKVKLGVVAVVAFIFSQSFVMKNYLIPVIALAVSFTVLIYFRRQVKEVIADERDRAIGGSAALLAIQAYSWVAVVSMFGFYYFSGNNPAYEPIAATLAYSTCLLMLIYSLAFRYHGQFKFSEKKKVYLFLAALLLAVMAIIGLRLFSGEDDWMCKDGAWVKHGQPSFPAPKSLCQ